MILRSIISHRGTTQLLQKVQTFTYVQDGAGGVNFLNWIILYILGNLSYSLGSAVLYEMIFKLKKKNVHLIGS